MRSMFRILNYRNHSDMRIGKSKWKKQVKGSMDYILLVLEFSMKKMPVISILHISTLLELKVILNTKSKTFLHSCNFIIERVKIKRSKRKNESGSRTIGYINESILYLNLKSLLLRIFVINISNLPQQVDKYEGTKKKNSQRY